MKLPAVPLAQQCSTMELGKNIPVLLQQCLVFKKNGKGEWEFLGSNGNSDQAAVPGTWWEEDNQWDMVLPGYQPCRKRKQDILAGEWRCIWRIIRSVMAQKSSKEERCAVEPLVTRCFGRIVLTIPCLGQGLIIVMWLGHVRWDKRCCSYKTDTKVGSCNVPL